jgi:hypothetical protein
VYWRGKARSTNSHRVKVATTTRKLTGDAAVRCLVGVGDGNWESQEAALGLCGALGPTRKGGEAVSHSGID